MGENKGENFDQENVQSDPLRIISFFLFFLCLRSWSLLATLSHFTPLSVSQINGDINLLQVSITSS